MQSRENRDNLEIVKTCTKRAIAKRFVHGRCLFLRHVEKWEIQVGLKPVLTSTSAGVSAFRRCAAI